MKDKDKLSRDYFCFYRSFKEAIDECPNEDQLEIYKAIANFALDGVKPVFSSAFGKVCWRLIEPLLVANLKKYINGCKGGAPIGNSNAKKQPKNNQKQANKEININNKESESLTRTRTREFQDFIYFLAGNCPYLYANLLLPKEEEYLGLLINHTDADIREACSQIENRSDLRIRYHNLFQTLKNWMKREDEHKASTKAKENRRGTFITEVDNEKERTCEF